MSSFQIINGDSTDPSVYQYISRFGRVDMIVTDPPYNVGYRGVKGSERKAIANDKMSPEKYQAFMTRVLGLATQVLKPGGFVYMFHATDTMVQLRAAAESADIKYKQTLIWWKQNFVMGWSDYHREYEPIFYGRKSGGVGRGWLSDRKQSDVISCKRPTRSPEHPTMKPPELIKYLLGNNTRKGELILDMFSGSGSTGVACVETGRRYIGIELDRGYAISSEKRIAEHARFR